MVRRRAYPGLLLGAVLWLVIAAVCLGQNDPAKTALAVDALSRLPTIDLESNPKLKETVYRVLEKTRGTPDFVRLVQKFQLPGQEAGLLEVATSPGGGESSVDAVRLLLASTNLSSVEHVLAGTNLSSARQLVVALGNSGDHAVMPLLAPRVSDPAVDPSVRKQMVQALARTADGAGELLKLARNGKLPADLNLTAGTALAQARWPEIQAEARNLFPPIQAQGAHPLPPIQELVRLKGDIHNGARLFTNAVPGCVQCHVVRGRGGVELGPELSEIGTKLGKDALYEAILDPSAGISFGFEAYNFTLKSGDEIYGLIASETAEEVAVKAVGGIITRLPKADITARQISKLSIMPAGLQAAMTTQELVDLVEYLSSLRKP